MGTITRTLANNITTGGVILPSGINNTSLNNVTALPAAISTGEITASSYSSAGYVRMDDGLIIQWGSGNSNATISFPLTFPNACRQVAAAVEGSGFWDSENIQVHSFSTSSFSTLMNAKNRNTSWIAVGY